MNQLRLIIVAAILSLSCTLGAVAQPLRGRVEPRTTTHPTMGHTVSFNIYLPEGYDTSTQRYPVIYHLHGIGGNQGGAQTTAVPRAFETARAAGIIGPVIIVFPNGYVDAWWANSATTYKPAESDVINALIPHVDATFRTLATPNARVIQGFSMGGFGATKFYTKFPQLFACCVEYDGALATWQTMQTAHAALAVEIFNSDVNLYNQYSAWYWTVTSNATLRQRPPIRMVVGQLVGGNRQFRDHLTNIQWPADYVETTCGHEIGCLMTAQGQQSAAFIASHIQLGCDDIDFNNNAVFPEDQDAIDFLNTLAGAPCPGCNDIDFNNNGVFPEDQDVVAFFEKLAGGSC